MSIKVSELLTHYEDRLVIATEEYQFALSKRETSPTSSKLDREVKRLYAEKRDIETKIAGLQHQIAEVSASKQLEVVRAQLTLFNIIFPMDLDSFPALAEFLDPKDGE